MTEEIISQSISTKVWNWARIELSTPGSAVRLVTNCTTGPDSHFKDKIMSFWSIERSEIKLDARKALDFNLFKISPEILINQNKLSPFLS